MNYEYSLKTLITETNGVVEGQHVLTPGCKIIRRTANTVFTDKLFDLVNIDDCRPEYEQNAEFASRLTYLSFRKEENNSEEYNRHMVEDLGHLSVYSDYYVTFLIAGVTIETVLELVAHTEAKVSRLTTSKTKAMSETLYRVFGGEEEAIKKFTDLRDSYRKSDLFKNREIFNMFNLGTKVSALTFAMNLKDFHKFFIGRLPTNNEVELREIATMMCKQLHELYPLVIRDPSYYIGSNNNEKYGTDAK
jgi:thymidylate synthase ThyX